MKNKYTPKRKALIAIRIDNDWLKKIKKIAKPKGLGYSSLIRSWIGDRLHKT